MNTFNKADEADRAGMATKATATVFVAASNFFDAMNVFGDLEPDIAERSKYAKWKAVDILKAISEGRTPRPGPPAAEGADDLELSSSGAAGGAAGGAAFAPAPIPAAVPVGFPVAHPAPVPYAAPAPAWSSPVAAVAGGPSHSPAAAAAAAAAAVGAASAPPAPTVPPPTVRYGALPPDLSDAHELCLFAARAVQAQDRALAISKLHAALARLQQR
jgi:vacuolar protein sorting-associated protein VTA1